MTRSRKALLATALVCAVMIGLPVYWITAMPGNSFHGELAPLSVTESAAAESMRRHVAVIASSEHNVGHFEALENAARYIEHTLTGFGYSVKRQNFESKAGKVRNLEVSIRSRHQDRRDHPIIVVGAHYDSAEDTPGANDNGSGTAALLELARRLKELDGQMDAELMLVFYVNEEPPYFKTEQMGSRVHAAEMHARGKNIVAMISLETLGYYSDREGSQHYPFPFSLVYPSQGNFIGFVGDAGSRPLVRHLIGLFRSHARFPSEGIAAPAFIPGIDWSDHWSYRQEAYSALMLTDTAPNRYLHYHTAEDSIDKIDFPRMARVVGGIEAMLREFARDPVFK